MKTVSITFVGDGSDDVAQAFYSWIIDGGLEDQIVDELTRLTDEKIEVEGIMDSDNDRLDKLLTDFQFGPIQGDQ